MWVLCVLQVPPLVWQTLDLSEREIVRESAVDRQTNECCSATTHKDTNVTGSDDGNWFDREFWKREMIMMMVMRMMMMDKTITITIVQRERERKLSISQLQTVKMLDRDEREKKWSWEAIEWSRPSIHPECRQFDRDDCDDC
jgi:hypothetical protein